MYFRLDLERSKLFRGLVISILFVECIRNREKLRFVGNRKKSTNVVRQNKLERVTRDQRSESR